MRTATVLVVEAGPLSNTYQSNQIDLVRDQLGWFTDTSFIDLMATEPNRELNNATTLAFVGKVVGGSSAINGMQAPRGTRDEYNRWAEVYGEGAEGWGWEGMLPYFKKVSAILIAPSLTR